MSAAAPTPKPTANTVTLAVYRPGMFPEAASVAMLTDWYKTKGVPVKPGTTLNSYVELKHLDTDKDSTKVIYGTYYKEDDIRSLSTPVKVMAYAEDLTGRYEASVKDSTVTFIPVISKDGSYPLATLKVFSPPDKKEPPNFDLIQAISKPVDNLGRDAAQFAYVEYPDCFNAANHIMFDDKFDRKVALEIGGRYAKKADSLLELTLKTAGHYVLPGNHKLAVVNATTDINTIARKLLAAGNDYALIARYSFEEGGYRYSLASTLSAIRFAKQHNFPAGGSDEVAGWICPQDIVAVLQTFKAQKQ